MKAIILAAGRGSRLKQHTQDQPKCLNRVGDRAIIDWIITALQKGGAGDIIIVTGYKSEMLQGLGARTVHNARWMDTNMVASLLCAGGEFDQPVLVSYSDIIYSSSIVSEIVGHGHDAVLAYDKNWLELWKARFENPLEDAESFRIEPGGRIVEIGQKAAALSDIEGQYMGLLKFEPAALAFISEYAASRGDDIDGMYMTDMLQAMIDSGFPVYGMPVSGGWCEIDNENDLELANQLFSGHELDI